MTTPDIRSSAQGLFMIMTNGCGATIGTLSAMAVVNHFVPAGLSPAEQLEGWRTCWYIFAGYALLVGILFFFIFKDNTTRQKADPALEAATESDPEGMASI